jgi:hypothetical protein
MRRTENQTERVLTVLNAMRPCVFYYHRGLKMKFFVIFAIFLTTITASAEIVFAPGASYFKQEDDSAGVTTETEISSYDLKLGYVGASGLYLGGMYQMSKLNDEAGMAAGPTLGFNHYSGFYALFTYFLIANQEASSTAEFTDGMGPQVDIGWVFPVTRMFMIGPQISYRSITYDKLDSGGASVDADYTRTNLLPYISLWFRF